MDAVVQPLRGDALLSVEWLEPGCEDEIRLSQAAAEVESLRGTSPVHLAARGGMMEVVLYHLRESYGVDVDVRDTKGRSVLWHALAWPDNEELIKHLLKSKARIEERDKSVSPLWNALSTEGITPLYAEILKEWKEQWGLKHTSNGAWLRDMRPPAEPFRGMDVEDWRIFNPVVGRGPSFTPSLDPNPNPNPNPNEGPLSGLERELNMQSLRDPERLKKEKKVYTDPTNPQPNPNGIPNDAIPTPLSLYLLT